MPITAPAVRRAEEGVGGLRARDVEKACELQATDPALNEARSTRS
jgi:hypothetical protein